MRLNRPWEPGSPIFRIWLLVLDYPTFPGTNGALLTKPTQRDGIINTTAEGGIKKIQLIF